MPPIDPFQAANEQARALAHKLMEMATHTALAVLQPNIAAPSVTRIAIARDDLGIPVSLISQLATHTAALEANPTCALLVGEPGDKGDPLTHPRLTLHCTARFLKRGSPEHDTLRTRYLSLRPKAKLYVDFPDFRFVRFEVSDGLLNGGFGQAFLLSPSDLI
ncbi:HugZ family protein [Tropicibacter sp. Alg240-R139]|uniref:HugZ family pyridoxamine 5'-phosphate oxidase n=1 Tax=Tropicibacter sp. Alg240-R139 TaxID=2305991 RepID=UPI0013E0628D|nr:pyridoxamine 5'-phosphate oxidase family protein [Tropicibacter sp. Alg240-R139]